MHGWLLVLLAAAIGLAGLHRSVDRKLPGTDKKMMGELVRVMDSHMGKDARTTSTE